MQNAHLFVLTVVEARSAKLSTPTELWPCRPSRSHLQRINDSKHRNALYDYMDTTMMFTSQHDRKITIPSTFDGRVQAASNGNRKSKSDQLREVNVY